MNRSEYLQRPLIEDVVFEIGTDRVKISCPNTLFINVNRKEKILLADVEKAFRELKNIAKMTGKIKLKGVTKFLPMVKALYPSYCAAVENIDATFSEMTELAHKLQSIGIHMGCNDDELLDEITAKQNKIYENYYRNTDHSRFLGYYKTINEALQNQTWKDNNIINYTIFLV